MYIIKSEHIISKKYSFHNACIDYIIREMGHLVPDNFSISVVDLDDMDDELKSFGGAWCGSYVDRAKFVYSSHITICDRMVDFLEQRGDIEIYGYRLKEFLNSIDLSFNNYTVFLFTLLHEIGHSYIFNLFMDAKKFEDYSTFSNLVSNTVEIFADYDFSRILYEENILDLPQFVNGLESQCDIFAYKYFMTVWKKVKDYINWGFDMNM